jgi:NAD(P)-dependent dehydrogenase (short-subunit alcohol dehydrogenase family)
LFAARGACVLLLDKNLEAASVLAGSIGAIPIDLDVGEEDSVKAAAGAIRDHYGDVDVLVNSAGVLQRTLPPGELSQREWDFVSRIDLRGTYLCCAVFGSTMAARGKGSIVNIASVAGMRSGPLHGYAPAKAGVISLTESLAGEWGPKGVRVNCVSPGFTSTPALDRGFSTHTLDEDMLRNASALGRLVNPEEVAQAVAFLASDQALAITGVNLAVDAGYLVAGSWAAYGGLRR